MILYAILGIFSAFSIYYYFTRAGPQRRYNCRLDGKIVIITGASAGVGKVTAQKLASLGATIIFACRDRQKTLPIIEQIKRQTKNTELEFIQIDLANYESVHQFAKIFRAKYDKIDLLINNAGLVSHNQVYNQQGHNVIIAANHLGHFLLTHLLQDLLVEKSRVINLSSEAHFRVSRKVDFKKIFYGECSFKMYAISKYINVLFTQGLQKKFNIENRNIKAVSVHPGFVRSEIFEKKNLGPWSFVMKIVSIVFRVFMLSEEEGAQTTLYTALQPFEELVPAGYYQKNNLSQASKLARTSQQEDELWDISKQELNIK